MIIHYLWLFSLSQYHRTYPDFIHKVKFSYSVKITVEILSLKNGRKHELKVKLCMQSHNPKFITLEIKSLFPSSECVFN
jgi:hypothetical protein